MERLRKYTTIFYSTHILDDVQRVSDTVAILNRGRLVAQAPIDQLLAGSEGTVYTVVVKGDPSSGSGQAIERAREHVASEPWVKSVGVAPGNGLVTWTVSVYDEQTAERLLLRLVLSDENLVVTEFGHKKHDLEEVFLNIVEGSEHVRA